MISKTLTFKDFNEKERVLNAHFHLSVDTITDNLNLSDKLEDLQTMLAGEQRELTTTEKQQMLDVVKLFIKLSYGVRSEDGSRFRAGTDHPEVWDEFVETGAYDAFLWSMFQEPTSAMKFMSEVMPKDAIEKARQLAEEQKRRGVPQDRLPKQEAPKEDVTVGESVEVPFTEAPDYDVIEEALKPETVEERRERLQRELAELG